MPAPGKLFPGAGEKSHSFTIEMRRFSRHRRPGAGKAVSRRREKVTFIHYREKCVGFEGAGGGKFWSECRFSGKLCPGAAKAVSRR